MLPKNENQIVDNEVIISLLYGISSEELISNFCSVNKILVESGFHNHLEVLDLLQINYEDGGIERTELPIEVDEILREASRICLLECGIIYDQEIDLDRLEELLEYGLAFDVTEDSQRLLDVIESSDDDLDALINLLSESTGRLADDWYEVITDVTLGLIDRIKTLCLNDLTSKLDEENHTTVNIRRDLLDKAGLLDSLLPELSSEEVKLSMESLIQNNLDHLDELSLEDSVKRLWTFSFLTNESFESATKNVDDLIESLYLNNKDSLKAQAISLDVRKEFVDLF